mgnify:FL=1
MKHNKRMSYFEYSLLASAFITMSRQVNGQVVYYDVIPDIYISNFPGENFDLDNNGSDDFFIIAEKLSDYNSSDIICYSSLIFEVGNYNPNNHIIGLFNPYEKDFCLPLTTNYHINSEAILDGDIIQYMTIKQRVVDCFSYTPEGDWHYFDLAGWHESATEDKFIGVRFDSGIEGCLYYGWIRCVFNESMDTLTVKDYAYNSVCNEGLFAGSLISSVQQLQAFEFNALVQQNQLFLTIPIKVLGARLTIHNSVGQDVFSKSINSETEVFDISTLAGGIYCAVLTFDGKQSGKLIYKK